MGPKKVTGIKRGKLGSKSKFRERLRPPARSNRRAKSRPLPMA